MSNIQITKLGIIKGGNCETIFKYRKSREIGTISAINWLLKNNCINICKGWCQIVKFPRCLMSMRWVIKQCSGRGANYELGWRRFITDIARPLFNTGKKFRLSQLRKWGATKAALEFSLGGTFRSGQMKYKEPHYDEIYKKWIED